MGITTVIAKPTRECNADCGYCSAPPESGDFWNIDTFIKYFNRVLPSLSGGAVNWIWHGGEPLLLSPQFYEDAAEYAWSKKHNIRFSIQSNILAYGPRWRSVFNRIFEGRISTSFDAESSSRTINGDAHQYQDIFKRRMNCLIEHGFRPLVITVVSKENLNVVREYSKKAVEQDLFDIRLNYEYPAGRALNAQSNMLTPDEYTGLLIELFDLWVDVGIGSELVPITHMLDAVLGKVSQRCPWTRNCGHRFLTISPVGDIHSCGQMADMNDDSVRYGNLNSISDDPLEIAFGIKRLLNSPGALKVKRRKFDYPIECARCVHFSECQGGCQRDAALFNRGLGGKFYYCSSWFSLLSRIKERLAAGELDDVIAARYLRGAA